jgi:ABC-type uncharacterized transport system involved in gliding motility auxiliary subunit
MPAKDKKRAFKYGSSSLISTIFFIGILVVIALIADRHPWRWDLTKSGAYTLSEQTRNILQSIDETVKINAFFATAAPEWADAKDLLQTYNYYNNQLVIDFFDPDRQPEKARQYEVRSYGTIVLEGYGKKQTILNADEQSITNAIFKLTQEQQKLIYFLIGHGEHSLDEFDKNGYSSVKSALQKENYDINELNLLQLEEVPEDAAVVVIAGPQKPLFSKELAALKLFLERGGKIMVLLDPLLNTGLEKFVEQYGIHLPEDIVIDKLSKVFGGSYLLPVVTEYGLHRITENFNIATFYPEARSVRLAENIPAGIQIDILASTSPNAWAETDFELLQQGQASFDATDDEPGPVPLMVIAEISSPQEEAAGAESTSGEEQAAAAELKGGQQPKKSYLLVAGDSDFINNTHFGLSGNGDFFLNMINFLAEEENLITIEARAGDGQPVILTQSQAQLLLWTVLVFVPLALMLIALSVYRIRRSQR